MHQLPANVSQNGDPDPGMVQVLRVVLLTILAVYAMVALEKSFVH
jgi:hypothetical protein